MVIISIFEHLFIGETFVIVPWISVMVIIIILTVIIVKRSAARQRKLSMARAKLSLSKERGSRALKKMIDDNMIIKYYFNSFIFFVQIFFLII
jgi:hypothetical protein